MSSIPKSYREFTAAFPDLEKAWDAARAAEESGPLDAKTSRLVKLGIAVGALKEGAVHSAVRKALLAGASREEIDHVIALAATTIGFPSAVAAFTWIRDTR